MSNVDFEIGEGNPAAVGFDSTLRSTAIWLTWTSILAPRFAALKDIGNDAEDLHFYGGQYGIVTEKPSPGWQFTLLDSTFEGQTLQRSASMKLASR